MRRELEENLARWERGEISPGELASRHPEDNTADIVSLYARLTALASLDTPDPTPGWNAVRARLQDRPARTLRRRRRRVHRPIVVAAAIVVLIGGVAVASEPVRRGAGRILDGLAHFLVSGEPSHVKRLRLALSAMNVSVYGKENTTVAWIPSVRNAEEKPLACAIASRPAHGHAWVNRNCSYGGYVPLPEFNGADAFTYTVSDRGAEPALATVTVTVTPMNDPPIARDDAATSQEDTTVTIDVLANDTDVDGRHLKVASSTAGSNGSVTINRNGTLTYTPHPDFNGADAFTYAVSDGAAQRAVAMVTITLAPVNDPPIARDDAATTNEDIPVTVDVLANDTDVEDSFLEVVSATAGSNGSVTINSDGTLTYTPDRDFNGGDAFTYAVSDGAAELVVATVTVTIAPVDDASAGRKDRDAGGKHGDGGGGIQPTPHLRPDEGDPPITPKL
jgi:VCBS repeat-containing protein